MKGLLKFITCGSVDDGKSTLIGRILYNSKLLYADQKRALELDSKFGSRGGAIDYSLLLDGLMAEREQGITIDVAYRYFTTDKRSFIVADTPGHEEYTRNMAVGASFAELAIILVDASKGLLGQTRRHARICSLMGIKHFLFAVNKMDLIEYDYKKFCEIEKEIKKLGKEIFGGNVAVIPVSAAEGDNVTEKSENMMWYKGRTILSYLENVDVDCDCDENGFYMPVQRVCRPNHTFRGFQGQIEAGSIAVGDEVIILPSDEKALVKSIYITDKNVQSASKGQPVTIQLNRELDVSRGCVITKNTKITTGKLFTATILWMDDSELTAGKDYFIKLGSNLLPGVVTEVKYKIDVNTGQYLSTVFLKKNEIAVCDILIQEKIAMDKFNFHKSLGELILIDRVTNMTSACGVVESISVNENNKDANFTFYFNDLYARGDIFEEFYYNTQSSNLSKYKAVEQNYTVGDVIPVKGKSYSYPKNVDILDLSSLVAIKVQDSIIIDIEPINEYKYTGVPIIDGRGFAVKIDSNEKLFSFLDEYKKMKEEDEIEFFNKWIIIETYRKIIFSRSHWF